MHEDRASVVFYFLGPVCTIHTGCSAVRKYLRRARRDGIDIQTDRQTRQPGSHFFLPVSLSLILGVSLPAVG